MDALQFCHYLKGVIDCAKDDKNGRIPLSVIERELSKVLTQGCGVPQHTSGAKVPITWPIYQRFDDGRFS